MARTDGLLHLFGRHSFPRSALEAMMSASTDDRVRGENPVNHGVAVLLEVEALLTDRGRGQHERPEGRIERLTHNAIGLSRAQLPRAPRAPTSYNGRRPARRSRCRVRRGWRSAASRGREPTASRPAPICSTLSHADLPSVPARSFTCSSAARAGRGSCKPALATLAHRCARRRRPATDRRHKPTRPSVTQTPTPLLCPWGHMSQARCRQCDGASSPESSHGGERDRVAPSGP